MPHDICVPDLPQVADGAPSPSISSDIFKWDEADAGSEQAELPSLINDNFERLDKVTNNSGCYFWKCKHCGHLDNSPGAKIQGHDNNLPSHIIHDCKNATPELCQKARTFIVNKTGDDGDQILSPAALSSSSAVIKKRKKISSLDGYVDYPLSDEQAKLANDLEANLHGCLHLQLPQAAVDEVVVVDHDGEDDGWDEASLMSSCAASNNDQHAQKRARMSPKGTYLVTPSPKTEEAFVSYLGDQYSAEDWKDALAVLFSGDGNDTIALANFRTLRAIYVPQASTMFSNMTNMTKHTPPYINDTAEVDDDLEEEEEEEEEEERRLSNRFVDDQARESDEEGSEAEDRNGPSVQTSDVASLPGPSVCDS
ncbi:hypothetical protein F4604DRAFT_1922859 [Suillus subluteus]|nr:hypothetical protein F4604DRAFT_1922859 [Suillus subluteus]